MEPLLGFGMGLPFHVYHLVGAGTLKLQAGYGAWIGAMFTLKPGSAIIFFAGAFAVLIIAPLAFIIYKMNDPETYPVRMQTLATAPFQWIGLIGSLALRSIL